MGKAAIVGDGGGSGGGWAARFLLNGWDVAFHDPDPKSAEGLWTVLSNARRSLPGLYDRPLPPEGSLTRPTAMAEAVAGADCIVVCLPVAAQPTAVAEIARLAQPAAVILRAAAQAADPAPRDPRVVTAVAWDPVYLIPLVEIAGRAPASARAAAILRGLGMFPLVRGTAEAPLAGRLVDAVLREAHAIRGAGLATERDIADALRHGPALLMALAGLQDAASPEAPPAIPDRLRDDTLVGVLRALRRTGVGAGPVIAAHDATLSLPEGDALPVTLCRQVPETWTDYNGHMSSHHYLEAGSLAGDRFMELIGVDAAYIAAGRSYFSVEDHIRYRAEIRAGDRITVTTQVLGGDGKRIHLFHHIHRGDGTLSATMETLLIHTDLALRRACAPDPAVARAFAAWVEAHAAHDRPKDAGRAVNRQGG